MTGRSADRAGKPGERPEHGPTRRALFGGALLLASSALALGTPAAAIVLRTPLTLRARRPVVAFHADQPYLDWSGTAEPYLPPAGLRTLDGLDKAALDHLVYAL